MAVGKVVASRSTLCVFITLLLLLWFIVKAYVPHPTINIGAKMPHPSINKQATCPQADQHSVHGTPEQLEAVRRQVASGVRTTAAFLRSSLKQLSVNSSRIADIKALLAEAEDRLRVIQLDLSSLDGMGNLTAWREAEAAALSQEAQRRIHALQNPPNCASVKKIVCNFRDTGAGSMIHHIVYCIMAAYGSGKIVALPTNGWRYSPKGWEVLFQPLSQTCGNVSPKATDPWPGSIESEAVLFPEWDKPEPKPPHQPMAVPRDIASRLQLFHEKPSDWWVGQFIAYMMRFQPEMQQMIDQVKEQLNFSHPIVGVQVRRTDKKNEAKLYPLEEYMTHVENYYLGLDLASSSGIPVRRRVFLASDQSSLITEAREKYPNYDFVWHSNSAEQTDTRYSLSGLKDLITELYFLAHSDYIVCTFSSNICRLAYEMMQSLHADAPSRVISLDTNYFFHQARPRYVKVRFSHHPDKSAKEKSFMDADTGQVLTAVNPNVVETGYTKIIVPGGVKLLPDYKVCDVLDVVNFPLTERVSNGNGRED